ncbi:MAG: hypothetical protein E7583_10915 [Ruminococcaceae bacterium]|nr:hypothetical protein [Oscillospiraceae bacterium]
MSSIKGVFGNISVKRISPTDGQYFFGYYDIQPFSADSSMHLVHKAPFANRLQVKGDICEIGILKGNKYRIIADTLAWNFQQGSMLQWNPLSPNCEVIYNDVEGDAFAGVVLDIRSGKKRYLERPVANVSMNGLYALSINFSRMYDFRPGYGYAYFEDEFKNVNHPKDDGVFVVDMVNGRARLVLSLEDIWKLSGKYFDSDRKLVINHITFSPDASKFVLLVRNFPKPGVPHRTCVIVCDREGTNPKILCDYCYFSHYWWVDNDTLVAFCDGDGLSCGGEITNYVYKISDNTGYKLSDKFFKGEDNHMSLDASGRFMLNDTYPNELRIQRLCVYDTEKDSNIFTGGFYSPETQIIDIRCDLHPRWARSGYIFTFDSTHEGFRGVYEIDFGEAAL